MRVLIKLIRKCYTRIALPHHLYVSSVCVCVFDNVLCTTNKYVCVRRVNKLNVCDVICGSSRQRVVLRLTPSRSVWCDVINKVRHIFSQVSHCLCLHINLIVTVIHTNKITERDVLTTIINLAEWYGGGGHSKYISSRPP